MIIGTSNFFKTEIFAHSYNPNKNSLEKLVDSNVSIHEKRKTLQKAQVGDGILQMASHLMLPLLRQALKR